MKFLTKSTGIFTLGLVISLNTTNIVNANINLSSKNNYSVISQGEKLEKNTIIPGKQVGLITKKTKKSDLAKIFGASRLKDETTRFFGGDAEFPGTNISLGKERSLVVLWKDKARTKIHGVMILDPTYKTADGIGVGTTLKTLREKFGEFQLSGFGWDYGGLPRIKSNKLKGMTLRLDIDYKIAEKYPDDSLAVSGDQELSSKDPRLERLNVKVDGIIFFFD
jgi:hypothetical protein